ncbi:MAG: hypothetical protein AAFY60_02585, partial [Myxococcota bacterium]
MRVEPFRLRFFAYSLVAHVAPAVVLGWVWQMVQAAPPPAPAPPIAVTLLYVDSKAGATSEEQSDAPESVRASERSEEENEEQKTLNVKRQRDRSLQARKPAASPERLAEARTASMMDVAGMQAQHGWFERREVDRSLEESHAPEVEAAVEEAMAPSASEPQENENEEARPRRSLRRRLGHQRAASHSESGSPQQDREKAMAENRRRINEAIPLTLWDDERDREVIGTVRVRFVVTRDG